MREAKENLQQAESVLYASQLSMAQMAWNQLDERLATHHLDTCQWDLRDWEHDYLYSSFTLGEQTAYAPTAIGRLRQELFEISEPGKP